MATFNVVDDPPRAEDIRDEFWLRTDNRAWSILKPLLLKADNKLQELRIVRLKTEDYTVLRRLIGSLLHGRLRKQRLRRLIVFGQTLFHLFDRSALCFRHEKQRKEEL